MPRCALSMAWSSLRHLLHPWCESGRAQALTSGKMQLVCLIRRYSYFLSRRPCDFENTLRPVPDVGPPRPEVCGWLACGLLSGAAGTTLFRAISSSRVCSSQASFASLLPSALLPAAVMARYTMLCAAVLAALLVSSAVLAQDDQLRGPAATQSVSLPVLASVLLQVCLPPAQFGAPLLQLAVLTNAGAARRSDHHHDHHDEHHDHHDEHHDHDQLRTPPLPPPRCHLCVSRRLPVVLFPNIILTLMLAF